MNPVRGGLRTAWFFPFLLWSLEGWALAQTHDSIVLIPAPINVKIPAGVASVSKGIHSLVRNGDVEVGSRHAIELQVSSDCPPGTVVAGPDFFPNTPAVDAVAEVGAGKTRRALTRLQVSSAAFDNINHRTPQRCTLTFHADTPIPGNVDPTPRNNAVRLELNVFDFNDPEQSGVAEVFVESMRVHHPKKVRVGPGVPVRVPRYRAVVGNGGDASDEILLTASDGDCPPGSVGIADLDEDSAGDQPSVTLVSGGIQRGRLPVTIDASFFYSTGHTVPDRCVATLSVSGSGGDTDNSNNTTNLIINVIDDNDF